MELTTNRRGGHVCKKTQRLNEHHLFVKRWRGKDKPFAGVIVGSFRCYGGGGYFVKKDKDQKVVEAYHIVD